MKRAAAIFGLVLLLTIVYLLHMFSTLIGLLFESGKQYAIQSCDIPKLQDTNQFGNGTQQIPKIIHQTYIDDNIPPQWKGGQQACIDLHPDYKYMLWTDLDSRNFIAKHYTWFLDTFDAYPHPIQRADVIRYFVLSHYGGIYLDLDDGCNRRLDPLLSYPAWLRKTMPTGISNDAMGSVPGHPFFQRTLDKLQPYARNWGMGVAYISVMYSTGPLFLSVMWKEYLGSIISASDAVHILMPWEYSKGGAEAFFKISKGSSWHGDDAKTIFWMGRHWMMLTVVGFSIAGVLIGSVFWYCGRSRKGAVPVGEQALKMMPMWSPTGRGSNEWLQWGRRRMSPAADRYYERLERLA